MPFVLVAATHRPNVEPDIAYIARYYFQGKRKSYEHLYVCRHDGSHRRQLTFRESWIGDLMWLDKKHLAFTDRVFLNANPDDTGNWTESIHIEVYGIESGRTRTLLSALTDSRKVQVDAEAKTATIKGVFYRIKPTKLIKDKPPIQAPDLGTPDTPGGVAVERKVGPFKVVWHSSLASDLEAQASDYQVIRNGVTKNFTMGSNTVSDCKAYGPNSVLLASEPWFQKFAKDSYLYLVNFDKGTSKLLVSDVGDIRFDVARHIWIGSQIEGRPLAPLKDGRHVWVNALYAGDWTTGKRWTIADGLVDVVESAIRPGQ